MNAPRRNIRSYVPDGDDASNRGQRRSRRFCDDAASAATVVLARAFSTEESAQRAAFFFFRVFVTRSVATFPFGVDESHVVSVVEATPHRGGTLRAGMSTKTFGGRAADVAFKTFTGALFATTVITGGWFAATSFSAASHYDKLAKEHKARQREAAEAARRRRSAERKRWRLFG